MREISITVGAGLTSSEMRSKLNGNDGENRSSMLHEVATAFLHAKRDERAEVHDVKVDEITIDPIYPSQVEVALTVGWSLYHGCRDRNQAGDDNFNETATYTVEGNLIFQVPISRRPPSDC